MIETITILDNTVSLYYLFWFFSMVAALVTGHLLRNEYGYSFSQATIYVVLDLVFGYLLIWATSWIFGGGRTIGFNFARIVSFVPLYFILMAKVFRETLWKLADFLAPVGAFFFGTSHFGCIFAGCCHGYPSEWGLYSNEVQTICFPIQPVEAVTSLLIGVVLFIMAKHKLQQGRLYVWFMILFGSTRFIFEFFRDNQKIWNNISDLALHAMAAFVLGIAALLIMRNPQRNEEES